MALKTWTFLFIWLYDVENSALLMNHTWNAIIRKKTIIILQPRLQLNCHYWKRYELSACFWKKKKLSHLVMFTGTVFNTLVPEYVIDCIVLACIFKTFSVLYEKSLSFWLLFSCWIRIFKLFFPARQYLPNFYVKCLELTLNSCFK